MNRHPLRCPNSVVETLYANIISRVQPVCVKLVKNVVGRWYSSSARSPPRPVANATMIWVIQSGWAGQPGMLMTGRPAFDRNSVPKKPPADFLKNCIPVESDGFGAIAGMPP